MAVTILVIDDEPDFITLIRCHFEARGFEVVAANTGMSGLNQARRTLPDVILLDMGLPDIDGLSVCEILRKQPSTARIPIVVVTAMNGEIARANAVVSGADHFLPKPFDRTTLCDCIERALRASSAEHDSAAAAPEGAYR
jgi:CheY-like chemotaxis protein